METRVDVVIVGAGPAGLAAGAACADAGLRSLVVEEGPDLSDRERNQSKELVRGVGGAGLFSDGKFSFYPSATALWSLSPRGDLVKSYAWFARLMEPYDLVSPPLPSEASLREGQYQHQGAFHFKPYPSFYVSPRHRADLTRVLVRMANRVWILRRVVNLQVDPTGLRVCLGCPGRELKVVRASFLIWAGGRFGPLGLTPLLPMNRQEYRRVELGVRLQQRAADFFLRDTPNLDPKLILPLEPGVEARTFCCCREGEILLSNFNGIRSLSGRADCPPTGRSNVGLTIRFEGSETGLAIWKHYWAVQSQIQSPLSMSAARFLGSHVARKFSTPIHRLFGLRFSSLLAQSLETLLDEYSVSTDSMDLHAPAVEGVGIYPKLTATLDVPRLPLLVAGDSTGLFRGLTAALVSGYFCGLQVIRLLGGN